MRLLRTPEAAAQKNYDLIVLGGGIYGAMLSLEASLRGFTSLVLEKEDFGGATSYNSLRIIHGGLRYLQTFNIKRYRGFVKERRWFLEHFPHLVQPLPVLMPLYQHGLRRTSVFRAAFVLDRLLSRRRNEGLPKDRGLPHGRVVSAAKVQALFPGVERHQLRGGALWYDACVPDSQRLIIEILRGACGLGATALNYMPATELLLDESQVVGVRARDTLHKVNYEFRAPVVVNATGPWSRDNASRFDQDLPALFRPSIAWNVLFDREAPALCALGVTPPRSDGRIYFVHPWKGRLLVGTGHAPRSAFQNPPRPTYDELTDFIDDLNAAIPGLNVTHQGILHVFAGFLPTTEDGTVRLAQKDCFIDHVQHGGPQGLFSVGSTKLTAARSTADEVLARIFPARNRSAAKEEAFREACAERNGASGLFAFTWQPHEAERSWRESLGRIIEEEAVCHLDDLMLRRTNLGDNPARALKLAPVLCDLFAWDLGRRREEIRRVERHFSWMQRTSDVHTA